MNSTYLSEPTNAIDLVQNWLDRIKERCSDDATIAGITSGFFDLDWLTDGLQYKGCTSRFSDPTPSV
jgi:replicative DNA helicase